VLAGRLEASKAGCVAVVTKPAGCSCAAGIVSKTVVGIGKRRFVKERCSTFHKGCKVVNTSSGQCTKEISIFDDIDKGYLRQGHIVVTRRASGCEGGGRWKRDSVQRSCHAFTS